MTLGRIGAGLLRPVNVNERPYPWVGSGTHAWVHYDQRSRSHVCSLRLSYSGKVTLDWGDGSQNVVFENGNHSIVWPSHTYSDGDYRIDITGDTPLQFGSYSYSNGSFTYADTYGLGFMSNDIGFSTNMSISVYLRDALVQFETDSQMFVGTGNPRYVQIGATGNLKWIMLTEATALANNPFAYAYGLKGLYAPKCEKFWGLTGSIMPLLTVLDMPKVSSFYDDSLQRPGDWFDGKVPSLVDFSSSAQVLPPNFLRNIVGIRKASFPNISGVVSNLLHNAQSLREIVVPEGVTELAGESFRSCNSAELVSFPSTLVSISNNWAFYGLYNLTTIVCKATTPPTLANNNILNGGQSNSGFAVWVPQGTISTYESATNWTKFAGKFHELDANGNIPQS